MAPPYATLLSDRIRVEPCLHGDWAFRYPRLGDDPLDRLDDAIDHMHARNIPAADRIFSDLRSEYPEFLDAGHHLALLYDRTSRGPQAERIWRETIEIGFHVLPDAFRIGEHRLPWSIVDNRPFLRACHGLGLKRLRKKKAEGIREGLDLLRTLLLLNPEDHQGVRGLLAAAYLRLGQPKAVRELCDHFRDDLPDLAFARPLALLQLGHPEEAEPALRRAVRTYPHIGKELTKRTHRPPKGMDGRFVTLGGADEAYAYWQDYGRIWKETPGAIDLARKVVGARP